LSVKRPITPLPMAQVRIVPAPVHVANELRPGATRHFVARQ